MKRLLVISLLALAAAGAALPAAAQDSLTCDTQLFGEYDADGLVGRLHEKGVDAVTVGEWGPGTIVATVRLPNGHTGFRYFNVETLDEIGTPMGAPVGQRTPTTAAAPAPAAAPVTCPPSLVAPESSNTQ